MKVKGLINHIVGEMGEDVSRNDFTLGLSRQEICILAEWYEDAIAHATEKGVSFTQLHTHAQNIYEIY